MNIYTGHPNFNSFIKNELDTLTYLTTRSCLVKYEELHSIITSAQREYYSAFKKGRLDYFNFHAKLIMEVERSLHFVIIGGKVTHDFQECSYFLALTDKNDENQLIRKFHFDYAINSTTTLQDVPSYHLQYGGKMSPQMQEDGLKDEKLDHWLSLPRFNFQPMNLALLLDLMLCEFRTEDTNRIAESSEWRALIFDNENFLSKSYFNSISNYINSSLYNKSKLLRDFCYGS